MASSETEVFLALHLVTKTQVETSGLGPSHQASNAVITKLDLGWIGDLETGIRRRAVAVPLPSSYPKTQEDLRSFFHFIHTYTPRPAAFRFSSSTQLPPIQPFFIFTMKFFAAVSLLAGLGAALPTAPEVVQAEQAVEARQLLGDTRNELQTGGACPPVIFIFARGSTESGNLVCRICSQKRKRKMKC